jgi:hypothetical protein
MDGTVLYKTQGGMNASDLKRAIRDFVRLGTGAAVVGTGGEIDASRAGTVGGADSNGRAEDQLCVDRDRDSRLRSVALGVQCKDRNSWELRLQSIKRPHFNPH